MILALILIYVLIVLLIGRFLAFNDLWIRETPNESLLNGLIFRNIKFKGENGILLRGWFVQSRNSVDGRTVFLLHGWLSNRNKLANRIKMFSENGYHVFIYDQRSHGNSENALVTYGDGEGYDLIEAVKYSKIIPEINQSRLFAAGYSLGTGSIIYACALSKQKLFNAIVLEGVFKTSYDVGLKTLSNRFGRMIGTLIGLFIFTPGVQIWSLGKFQHSETAMTINKLKNLPIMIVRGEFDNLVIKESAQALILNTPEPKTLWYHNGGHTNASKLFPNEYLQKVIGFLNSNL
jgi:alpha-beta hydrolase superfamily lysophospholipase